MIVPGGGLSTDHSRWISCRPRFLLSVRVLSHLFRRLFLQMLRAAHAAGRLEFFADHGALGDEAAFGAYIEPLQRPSGRSTPRSRSADPRPSSPISRATPTASPSRTTVSSSRPERRHVQIQGLPHRRTWPIQDDDTAHPRVHPPLPDPRPAQGLPPHQPLRPVRQRQPSRQPGPRPRAAPRGASRDGIADREDCYRRWRNTRRAASMSLLWRPHGRHRGLRPQLRAEASAATRTTAWLEGHLLMPSTKLPDGRATSDRRWSATSLATTALQASRSAADGACQPTTPPPRPPFDPITAPSWPGRATTQAVPTRRHRPLRRPRIPIAQRHHRACPIPAISCLGASRTPPAARAQPPASPCRRPTNLHRSDRLIDSLAACSSMTG
jgi:hypothetical protein